MQEKELSIPEREKWLFENEKSMNSVLKGIEQSAQGKVKSLGSFSKFAEI